LRFYAIALETEQGNRIKSFKEKLSAKHQSRRLSPSKSGENGKAKAAHPQPESRLLLWNL
jgi:hypothetical protein